MPTELTVDKNLCQNFAVCVGIAPDYFELDHNGELMVLRKSVHADDEDMVDEAAMVCPTQAIIIRKI